MAKPKGKMIKIKQPKKYKKILKLPQVIRERPHITGRR